VQKAIAEGLTDLRGLSDGTDDGGEPRSGVTPLRSGCVTIATRVSVLACCGANRNSANRPGALSSLAFL